MIICYICVFINFKQDPLETMSFATESSMGLWESTETNCYCKMRNWKGNSFMIYLIVVQTFDTRALLNFTVGYY